MTLQPPASFPTLSARRIARMRRRIRRRLARDRAQRVHLAINWEEVAEIDQMLNAAACDPDEWS
jgi:hypothetical protein